MNRRTTSSHKFPVSRAEAATAEGRGASVVGCLWLWRHSTKMNGMQVYSTSSLFTEIKGQNVASVHHTQRHDETGHCGVITFSHPDVSADRRRWLHEWFLLLAIAMWRDSMRRISRRLNDTALTSTRPETTRQSQSDYPHSTLIYRL